MSTFEKSCYALAFIILILGLIIPNQGRAEGLAVYAGAWSKHLVTGDEYDYNESHDLLAVEYKSVLVARFVNSYNRETWAAGYGWSRQWGDFRGTLYAGVMRGYRKCYGDAGDEAVVCPMAVPMISYTKYRVQPTVLLMGEAAAFSVRFEF